MPREFSPDLILSDYDLPQYNGALALAESKKRLPEVPFILVTGALNEKEDRVVKTLKAGAHDCVWKNQLDRLAPVIHKALSAREGV